MMSRRLSPPDYLFPSLCPLCLWGERSSIYRRDTEDTERGKLYFPVTGGATASPITPLR